MAENEMWRGRMEVRMDRVEEGVANFRDFQVDARRFFATFEANEEHRKAVDRRRSKIHFAILALLTGLIIALFTVVVQHYADSKNRGLSFFTSETQPTTTDATAAPHAP